ncbi:uncharacterized protein LOC119167303 [Rhipicephalus microplus]|uniref:uncharacterized protein LOC119167303 n=1 Tax=Rhipicephalus microplus TaxID=6941 RepID=UPI003F6B6437
MLRTYAGVGIILFATSMIGASHAKLKDGCTLEKLRACGDDYLPFGKRSQIATSGAPFVKQCRTYKEQISCSRNFVNDCLIDVFKDAAILALDSYKASIDEICTPGSKLYNAYHKSVGCLNSAGTKIHGCVNDFFGHKLKAISKAPREGFFAYFCCSYGGLFDCLEPALKSCEKVGGRDFTVSLVEKVFGDALTPLCGSHEGGSELCKSLPNLPALDPLDQSFKHYVELIIEAVDTLISQN